jgi:hypothetical protein
MATALYVILRHEGVAKPHFDLMFQTKVGSKLATWRSETWRPREPVTVEKIGDHRMAYLTFEGEISGNRGSVKRVEQGICDVEKSGNVWNIELTPVPAGEKFSLTICKEPNGVWKAQAS